MTLYEYEKMRSTLPKIINEWTEHSSDSEICFYKTIDGKIHKSCEWRFVSESEVIYIAYNRNGSINHQYVYSQTWEEWKRVHNKNKGGII